MRNDELYHYGVKGMKWRFRKSGRKELGEETLGEKSPNDPTNLTKSIHKTKNSRYSYRTGTAYDNPDGSRSLYTSQYYHKKYMPSSKNSRSSYAPLRSYVVGGTNSSDGSRRMRIRDASYQRYSDRHFDNVPKREKIGKKRK